jgi:hypothetical protein
MENRPKPTGIMQIDEILAVAEDPAYKRAATARILLRQDYLQRFHELEDELTAAMERDRLANEDPTAPAVADAIAALEAQCEDEKVEFRFVQIGHSAWLKLMAAHPPTPQQKRDFPAAEFNIDTFPAAAVAASCQSPAMTPEDALRLESALNEVQYAQLWGACLNANVGGGESPKSPAAGLIRRLRDESGTTPASEGSPDQSSLDEL